MDARRGEKFGWIGGWLGGFVWVVILSGVFLVQGRVAAAGAGLILTAAAVAAVLLGVPWRSPDTPYWKLMLPIYLVFAASAVWLVWLWEPDAGWRGFNAGQSLILLPIALPFWTAGRRRWNDPPGGGRSE